MASIFRREHDAEGREVIEIGMNTTLFLALALAMPAVFVAGTYYALGDGPQGVPWSLPALAAVFAVVACALVVWMGRRSTIRVTIDGNAGKLLVGTSDGATELPMAEVSRAEFAAAADRDGSALQRLELVLRNGQRVPATSGYFRAYAEGHRMAAIKVINAALGRQMI